MITQVLGAYSNKSRQDDRQYKRRCHSLPKMVPYDEERVKSHTAAPPNPSEPTDVRRARNRSLIDGPRWYRTRIRSWGPLVGLTVPTIIGVLAYASLKYSDAAPSGAMGLLGGVIAAPGLLVVGAPFGDSNQYPLAIAASSVLWIMIGLLASRQATRNPLATWADYWRHYFWLAGGIWVGAAIALGLATVSIGEALF